MIQCYGDAKCHIKTDLCHFQRDQYLRRHSQDYLELSATVQLNELAGNRLSTASPLANSPSDSFSTVLTVYVVSVLFLFLPIDTQIAFRRCPFSIFGRYSSWARRRRRNSMSTFTETSTPRRCGRSWGNLGMEPLGKSTR